MFRKIFALGLLALAISNSVNARAWVKLDDASKLKYQVFENKVWLRNVNEFDSSWRSCCYGYYIDLTQEDGRPMWSDLLAKMAQGKRQKHKYWCDG